MTTETQQNPNEGKYEFKLSQYINEGFTTVFKQPGLFIGFLAINMAIAMGVGIFGIFGSLINLVLHYPLQMGYAIGADKVKRDEQTVINDFFKGFQKTADFLLLWLLVAIITFLVMSPAFVFLAVKLIGFFKSSGFSASNGNSLSTHFVEYFRDPDRARAFAFFLLQNIAITFLLLIPGFLVGMLYAFAPYFVYFKNKHAWEAMEASRKIIWKKLGSFLVFFIVLGLINMLGAICLFIGLLVTVPATTLALFMAFDDIVGAREIMAPNDNIQDHFIVS